MNSSMSSSSDNRRAAEETSKSISKIVCAARAAWPKPAAVPIFRQQFSLTHLAGLFGRALQDIKTAATVDDTYLFGARNQMSSPAKQK